MKWVEVLVVAFYICIALFSMYWMTKVTTAPNLYCGVAEISPDFSQHDRERCRQIRGKL